MEVLRKAEANSKNRMPVIKAGVLAISISFSEKEIRQYNSDIDRHRCMIDIYIRKLCDGNKYNKDKQLEQYEMWVDKQLELDEIWNSILYNMQQLVDKAKCILSKEQENDEDRQTAALAFKNTLGIIEKFWKDIYDVVPEFSFGLHHIPILFVVTRKFLKMASTVRSEEEIKSRVKTLKVHLEKVKTLSVARSEMSIYFLSHGLPDP